MRQLFDDTILSYIEKNGYQALELAFSSKKLRAICEQEAKAVKFLEDGIAMYLQRRLSDLRAADVVTDLIVGNPSMCAFDNNEAYSIDLPKGYKIFFLANHVVNPTLSEGKLDWSNVNRIKIISISK